MIVLSAGTPKSGTSWYHNLTKDILVITGHQDADCIGTNFISCRPWSTKIVRAADRALIRPDRYPPFLGNTFMVKTHHGPSTAARYLITSGIIRATFIYRDPWDAAVPASKHGQMLGSKWQIHPSADLNSGRRYWFYEAAVSYLG